MTDDVAAFEAALDAHLARGFTAMRSIEALVAGRVERPTLVRWVVRYYAELRCFLDVKLPERMRICPFGACDAKALFAQAYVEEQGGFRPGEDHATLFARVAAALAIAPEALEEEARRYTLRQRGIRAVEPSRPALVRELAITCAWENAAPRLGRAIATALAHHYGIARPALAFFVLHEEVDRRHGAEARRVLLRYVETPPLAALALAAVDEALDLEAILEDVR